MINDYWFWNSINNFLADLNEVLQTASGFTQRLFKNVLQKGLLLSSAKNKVAFSSLQTRTFFCNLTSMFSLDTKLRWIVVGNGLDCVWFVVSTLLSIARAHSLSHSFLQNSHGMKPASRRHCISGMVVFESRVLSKCCGAVVTPSYIRHGWWRGSFIICLPFQAL